ncbi:amidohydrolase [Archangium violaceum]|nr:amidohydrolase [Archangium violaceum]
MRVHPLGSILILVWLFTSGWSSVAGAAPVADTVVVNARVYTVDARKPWAEAIAIRKGRILAVGSNAEISRYRANQTRIIDAEQRLVLPSLTDCHVHFLEGSLGLSRLGLDDAQSIADVQRKLKEFAAAHPDSSWLVGRGWTYPIFGESGLPHKRDLDVVVSDRPVVLEGYDMHTVWANSKALAAAGITRETPDPPHGTIVRDAATGEPTGTLKESAAKLLWDAIPRLTDEERLEALRKGLAEANRLGLGRLHSAGRDQDVLPLFERLRQQDQLTARLYVALPMEPPSLTPEFLARLRAARSTYQNEWLSTGAVKIVVDGIVETHTAAMFEPYVDVPSERGEPFWAENELARAVTELDRQGFQLFTHAIGDRAVRLTLDTYQRAAKQNASRNRRHRIEHLETLTEQDASRLGKLGIIASFQPFHAYPDATTLDTWAGKIGPERASRGFGWQRIVKGGGKLAFGSDWPVVTLNPWYGIQTAVTRETEEGKPPGGWLPEQRLSLEQALRAYTLDAAFAARLEKEEGSLEAGKRADLIMLSRNVFEIDPREIRNTEVQLTMVGGKIVYRK